MTDDLDRAYDRFSDEVFRLETLPDYPVAEYDERQRVFLDQGRLLPPPPRKLDWLAFVREKTAVGRRIHRVHVVDYPLTPYLRYEFAVYAENVDAGEEVRIADRAAHPDLATLRDDFILFDGDTDHAVVCRFDYAEDGRQLGFQVTHRERDVDAARRHQRIALAHSVPLGQAPTA